MATVTFTVQANLSLPPVASLSLSYDIVADVGSDLSYSYHLSQPADFTFVYDSLALVQADLNFSSDIVSFVGAELAHSYNMNETVTASTPFSYSIANFVQSSLNFSSNIVNFVGTDFECSYSINRSVHSTTSYSYTLRALVTVEGFFSYDAWEQSSPVSFTLQANLWDPFFPYVLFDFSYAVGFLVNRDLVQSYDIGFAKRNLTFTYDSIANASSDLDQIYTIFRSGSKTFSAALSLFGRISSDLPQSYDLISKVSSDLPFEYDFSFADLQFGYSIPRSSSQSFTAVIALGAIVGSSVDFTYNIAQNVGQGLEFSYDFLPSSSLTFTYNITLIDVSGDLPFSYDSASTAGNNFQYSYGLVSFLQATSFEFSYSIQSTYITPTIVEITAPSFSGVVGPNAATLWLFSLGSLRLSNFIYSVTVEASSPGTIRVEFLRALDGDLDTISESPTILTGSGSVSYFVETVGDAIAVKVSNFTSSDITVRGALREISRELP